MEMREELDQAVVQQDFAKLRNMRQHNESQLRDACTAIARALEQDNPQV